MLAQDPLEETAGGPRDYQRVVRAIEFLRSNAPAQPDLAAVASHLHLSEHHFQRLFTRWAGVSPKRFLQYLTVEHAKRSLAGSRSVLEAADAAGLSGPGRLHDQFVTLAAMSPGEFRSGGAGLIMRYGIHDSPFGPFVIATTRRGVCALHFLEDGDRDGSQLREEWPRARRERDDPGTAALARRIFDPLVSRAARPLALAVPGTNFQIQVWRALIELPPGAVITYRDVAARLGRPRCARAVGSAIGANPIAWLIPCHRVIRESGVLSGYRWGVARKAAMLGWEAARHAAAGACHER